MSTETLILVAAAIAVVVGIAILFKVLWKVPRADEALIVTGFGVKGAPARRAEIELGPDGQPTAQAAASSKTFKIVTGGGAFVIPALQKAQYLSLRADAAELEVTGVDKQKIPVGVKGVAIFKVGDDDQSITNAATRFLDEGVGEHKPDAPPGQGGLPRPPALDHRRAVGRGPDRQPQRARRRRRATPRCRRCRSSAWWSTRSRSRTSSTRPATSPRSASRAPPRSRCRRASPRPPPTARRPSASRRPRR